ncbi:MAG: 3-phosphoshikimate 1-carboxyvinyltransferase [Thermodesulfobacteriota bacterium]|nr:3-phosphoshikimate 1-carboxyvinyltransferase [Thermodesulfobacteriota bacterium]
MKKIKPISKVDKRMEVPGSKSLTQRALIAAALADGESYLHGPLASEDTHYTSTALRMMGVEISGGSETDSSGPWIVKGQGGLISAPADEIFLGNNGTATRFLTSVAALGTGTFRITGEKRMEERPIKPLMDALVGWGCVIKSIKGTGCPPLEIRATGLAGGKTLLPEGKSSQYLSSLLLVAPYARKDAELEVEGMVPSRPYAEMTLAVMEAFGITGSADDTFTRFTIPHGVYSAGEYYIEGDASSASYFWASAAVTGGTVTVANVPVKSLQGDTKLVDILARMGCKVESSSRGITVSGPSELKGIEVDMGSCPDVAPTLAIVASRAKGKTIIKNISHLRIKECDRINAVATELSKLGVKVEELPDSLIIHGQGPGACPEKQVKIETYKDHRIAMCFAVAGLVFPGITITGEECVAKSFPDFWERFERLY